MSGDSGDAVGTLVGTDFRLLGKDKVISVPTVPTISSSSIERKAMYTKGAEVYTNKNISIDMVSGSGDVGTKATLAYPDALKSVPTCVPP